MPRGGRGNASAPAFISLTENSAVRGFTIFYPDQAPDAAPVPYPWTLALSGNNPAVIDVELLNSWNGISAVGAPRHYIARVQGQPINIGLFIDQTCASSQSGMERSRDRTSHPCTTTDIKT
jgi:hypothetical protein